MLKYLRKKGFSKKVLWFTAIVIILSFGVFGTAYLISDLGQSNYAGKIFGKKISLSEFDKTYRHVIIQSMIRYGDNFENVKAYLDLEGQTWERLILLDETIRQRIKVSNEDVVQAISEYPFFQRDGQFDTLLYNNILNYVFKISPREFEEGTRDNIKFAKLFQQITLNAAISEYDILQAYKKKNEKAQVSYILVSPEQFQNSISVTDQEIKQYFHRHIQEFETPLSIVVDYITLTSPPSQTPDPSQPTENNTAQEELQTKADALIKELVQNPDMTAAAAKNNLEVKTTNYFTMEQPELSVGWSYETLNQLFQSAAGEISGPHKIADGYLIAKIKDRRAPQTPELTEVTDTVKNAVSLEKARGIAGEKAQEYFKNIQEVWSQAPTKNFPAIAKNLNLEITQTPLFGQGQYLPKIGISKEFQDATFALNEGNPISSVVEIGNLGFTIIHLDNIVPAEMNEFEQQKSSIQETLIQEKRNQIFGDFMAEVQTRANLENYLSRKTIQ
jgi:peptidyl-prolyl cis-trans isomerase D